MSPFDPYFALLRSFLEGIRTSGRPVRTSIADRPAENEPCDGASQIVLKENTAVEMGGPLSASSGFTLWTHDISLIVDGRITLAGPDASQCRGKLIPFGQVLLAGGPGPDIAIQPRLERELYAAERLSGYMVRGTGGRLWARVSTAALDSGFNFHSLGGHVLNRLRRKLPDVTAAEILFVTSSTEDVRRLEKIGAQVRKLSHDLRRERIRQTADGELECETGLSCEVCPDNPVCSEIREVLVIRKGKASR